MTSVSITSRSKLDWQPSLPLALADAEQIKRVLVNLIENAATKHSPRAEGLDDRRITIETREEVDRDGVAVDCF